MDEGYVEVPYIIPATLLWVWNYFKIKLPKNNKSKEKNFLRKKKKGQILTVLAYLEDNNVHVTKVWPMSYKTRPGQAFVYSDKRDSLLRRTQGCHPHSSLKLECRCDAGAVVAILWSWDNKTKDKKYQYMKDGNAKRKSSSWKRLELLCQLSDCPSLVSRARVF